MIDSLTPDATPFKIVLSRSGIVQAAYWILVGLLAIPFVIFPELFFRGVIYSLLE